MPSVNLTDSPEEIVSMNTFHSVFCRLSRVTMLVFNAVNTANKFTSDVLQWREKSQKPIAQNKLKLAACINTIELKQNVE